MKFERHIELRPYRGIKRDTPQTAENASSEDVEMENSAQSPEVPPSTNASSKKLGKKRHQPPKERHCSNCDILNEANGNKFDPRGHFLKDCTRGIDRDGFMNVCPFCDTTSHNPNTCPAAPPSARNAYHYLVETRAGKPPIRCDWNLRDLDLERWSRTFNGNLLRPQTPYFALQSYKDNGDQEPSTKVFDPYWDTEGTTFCPDTFFGSSLGPLLASLFGKTLNNKQPRYTPRGQGKEPAMTGNQPGNRKEAGDELIRSFGGGNSRSQNRKKSDSQRMGSDRQGHRGRLQNQHQSQNQHPSSRTQFKAGGSRRSRSPQMYDGPQHYRQRDDKGYGDGYHDRGYMQYHHSSRSSGHAPYPQPYRGYGKIPPPASAPAPSSSYYSGQPVSSTRDFEVRHLEEQQKKHLEEIKGIEKRIASAELEGDRLAKTIFLDGLDKAMKKYETTKRQLAEIAYQEIMEGKPLMVRSSGVATSPPRDKKSQRVRSQERGRESNRSGHEDRGRANDGRENKARDSGRR